MLRSAGPKYPRHANIMVGRPPIRWRTVTNINSINDLILLIYNISLIASAVDVSVLGGEPPILLIRENQGVESLGNSIDAGGGGGAAVI